MRRPRHVPVHRLVVASHHLRHGGAGLCVVEQLRHLHQQVCVRVVLGPAHVPLVRCVYRAVRAWPMPQLQLRGRRPDLPRRRSLVRCADDLHRLRLHVAVRLVCFHVHLHLWNMGGPLCERGLVCEQLDHLANAKLLYRLPHQPTHGGADQCVGVNVALAAGFPPLIRLSRAASRPRSGGP